MRTRSKGYSDYGLTDDRVKEIMQYCRDKVDMELIEKAAELSNSEIKHQLVESLTEKKSYERISMHDYIYICEKDFYGYRRHMVAILDNLLKERE